MQKIFSTDFTIPHNAERIHYFPLLSWILVSSQSCLEQPKQVTGQINLPTKCIRVLFMSLIMPPFLYCSWGSHGKNTEIICHSHSLNDWNNHEGVVTHLELDILECEVKWALGSITMNKTTEGDGFQLSCFKSWKMLLLKCRPVCQQMWITLQWQQDWRRSVFIPISKKGDVKECSNDNTVAFVSRASKVMLKILQAKLQLNVNREFTDVQTGFRKGRGTRDHIANKSLGL